jgi:hypothetical protein
MGDLTIKDGGFTWLGFHMVGVSHGLYNRLTMKKVI